MFAQSYTEKLTNVDTSGLPLRNFRKEKAAHLVARDQLTDQRIAETLGISRRTLSNWKKLPEIQDRIRTLAERYSAALEASVAQRERSQEIAELKYEATSSRSSIARHVAIIQLKEMGSSL